MTSTCRGRMQTCKTVIPSWAPDVAQIFTSDSWPPIAATLPCFSTNLMEMVLLVSFNVPKGAWVVCADCNDDTVSLEFLVSLRVCPDGDVWHNVWTAEHVQIIHIGLQWIVNMCQWGLRRNRSETDSVWCHICTEAVSFRNFAFRWGKDANLQNNYP